MKNLSPLLVLLVLAGAAGSASAAVSLDQRDVIGLTGGYYGTRTSADSPVGTGVYRVGAEVRTFRFQDAMRGTKEEYLVRGSRELYHVALSGWLGTAPPNAQRAAYHLAGGEARMVFYGRTLGPERPELSAKVWESSGPAPSADSLDRTWVTRLRVIYNNVDNHLQQPARTLVVVENMWQFEAAETWRDRATFGMQAGGARYTATIPNNSEVIFQDIIDYPGIPMALRGWPNNYMAAFADARLGSWKASVAGTRLNLLDSGLIAGCSVELEKTLSERWKLRAGYYRRRRRGIETREGLTVGMNYLWGGG